MAPKYKLIYFDSKGRAEVIRYLLSYGNVEFEDVRVSKEDWPKVKETIPYGQLPVLEVDGKMLLQSAAICRYLGRIFNIAGKNEWEAAQIDALVDTLATDISHKIREVHTSPENKKEECRENIVKNVFPFYLEKFDKQVKENGGYFVGGKLSWADIYWVGISEVVLPMLKVDLIQNYPNLKTLREKVNSIPQIKKWVDKRPEEKTTY